MQGLRLTIAQASRLWHMDAANCESVLQTLVNEMFLARTKNGAFVALPTDTRSTPAPRRRHTIPLPARTDRRWNPGKNSAVIQGPASEVSIRAIT
jgi:hypothetical protein